MIKHLLAAGSVSLLVGCSAVETPDSQSAIAREAIIGGTLTTGDEAVVLLAVGQNGNYQEYCTGTLVAPQTVLTAAHCIEAYGQGNYYYVLFGPTVRSPHKVVKTAAQYANPCYQVSSAACPNNQEKAYYDFGVLKLEQPVLDVAPIEMSSLPMSTADIGKKIRHVGFGITETGRGDGTKREVTYNVRSVLPLALESGAMGAQTCSGDSGGPAFMVTPGSTRERVVGVVSFGDQDCNQFGVDGRVDVGLGWINTTMLQWEVPSCGEDGRCAANCPQIDQDCVCVADGQCTADCHSPGRDVDCPANCATNGVCAVEACPLADADCVALGETCTKPEDCKTRLCIRDGNNTQSYCSATCKVEGDCQRGMTCGPVGQCILKPKNPRNTYEICNAMEDICVGGNICDGPAGGLTRCVKPCTSPADCTDGATCDTGTDNKRFCRPPESTVRFTSLQVPEATLTGQTAPGCASATGLSSAALWSLLILAAGSRKRRCARLTV